MFLRKIKRLSNIRHYSMASQMHIEYREFGDPRKVLHLRSERVTSHDSLADKDVHIRFLASPINPADINMIQGIYPIKPNLPAIGGNEGVAVVIDPGNNRFFKKGDWVVPNGAGLGTWSTDVFCGGHDIMAIPNDIPLVNAATLTVNPCTAYRILHDFAVLFPGDVIVQNGANGGVGRAVIQIANELGLQTVNLIQDNEKTDETITELKTIGATCVVTEKTIDSEMKNMSKARLTLNCIGGKSVIKLVKHMAPKSTLVTYGGLSKQPLSVPTGPFIFDDIKLAGYWMTRWTAENKESEERKLMFDRLISLMRDGKLHPPNHDLVPIQNFEEGIERSMNPMLGRKQILVTGESYISEYLENDYD